MKKRIFTILSSVVAAAFLLVSCYPEPLNKADIDAQFAGNVGNLPTLTLSATDVTFEFITLTVSASGTPANVLESGVMVFGDMDLTDLKSVEVFDLPGSRTLSVKAEQKYYLQAYIITNDGTSVSEAVKVTTPAAPVFEDTYLFGEYYAVDYVLASGAVDYQYAATITQVEGTYNKITIEGMWGYSGYPFEAEVDFATKTISATAAHIYTNANYGTVYMIDYPGSSFDNPFVHGTYKKEGSKVIVTFPGWAAQVSAGYFGRLYTIMEK